MSVDPSMGESLLTLVSKFSKRRLKLRQSVLGTSLSGSRIFVQTK